MRKYIFGVGIGILLLGIVLIFSGCDTSVVPSIVQSEISSFTKGVSNKCPAAPAIASLLLKEAGIDNRYDGGNYIKDVANEMGPGTDFRGFSKCEEGYASAVAEFLIEQGAEIGEVDDGQPEGCFDFDSITGTITDYDVITCGLDVVIPLTIGGVAVENIGNYAFYENGLISVKISNSVTSIGNYAFQYNQLTSVTIGNSVKSIGNVAFYDNQLTSVTIGNSVNSIGVAAFQNNQLSSVTIPNSVTSISYWAFAGNQLSSVTIPDSVLNIFDYTFAYNQLTSVSIGNSVRTIGDYAFYENQLTSVTIGADVAIDSNPATMGTNTGFKTVYDGGGKLAGTYNYTGGVWVKT